MKSLMFKGAIAAALAVVFSSLGDVAQAQNIDFSKAESTGNQVIAFLRGPLATIVLVLGFVITGYLAAMNRISWAWCGGIILAAFFIFAGPTLVDNLRSIMS